MREGKEGVGNGSPVSLGRRQNSRSSHPEFCPVIPPRDSSALRRVGGPLVGNMGNMWHSLSLLAFSHPFCRPPLFEREGGDRNEQNPTFTLLCLVLQSMCF